MQRTLKREFKELEVVEREAIKVSEGVFLLDLSFQLNAMVCSMC